MRIHFQVRLCLLDEDLHFVLVQAFVAAELQLRGAVLEVHITYSMADMAAPIAGLGSLEGGPSTLGETRFGAEAYPLRRAEGLHFLGVYFPVAPVTAAN